MTAVFKNVSEALGLEKREHLAVVGAGGKTSLLLALVAGLRDKKVVISTTTRMLHAEARSIGKPIISLQEPGWKNRLREGLNRENQVVLIGEVMASDKVKGISPSLADAIYREQRTGSLLLEADGAAGRSIKAPAEKEPVIPSSVTTVVAILGLDAVGQPFNRERVFREKEFRDITGIEPGEKLVPERLWPLFINPQGLFKGTPSSAKKTAFLNRLDLLADQGRAFVLADLIMDKNAGLIDRVVIGSVKEGVYYIKRAAG